MKTCDIIGISDKRNPWFPPEVLEIIRRSHVFSGGRRHHEIMATLLPEDATWIDITVPLKKVFEHYEHFDHVLIFASGDPLFFGFANTVQREVPEAELRVYPSFNSLQMLAHRLLMPYHDMRIVSLTGRPWHEFDRALIERAGKIGVLTDKEHTPAAIAQRMMEYGYTSFNMYVGENLGNPQKEIVSDLSLEEAATHSFTMPNCVILHAKSSAPNSPKPFGLPDSAFTLLNGREKMITKMPIRLITLQALDLPQRHVFWDIGFCTGSVSIEARLIFPHLEIHAFEIRPECEAIIHENARRFGAPGINIHMGDFLQTEVSAFSPTGTPTSFHTPDAVFIGGHGGHLKEILEKAANNLLSGGIIVMNCVTSPVVEEITDHRPSSRQIFEDTCRQLGLLLAPPMRIVLDDYNPIEILKATKPESTKR